MFFQPFYMFDNFHSKMKGKKTLKQQSLHYRSRSLGKETEICKQKVHWECSDTIPVGGRIGHRRLLQKRPQLILRGVQNGVTFRIPVKSRAKPFAPPPQPVMDAVCLQGAGITLDNAASFSGRQCMEYEQ